MDLSKVLKGKYGLNENPFKFGCNQDAVIDDMPVNFKQMCGLQTPQRVLPENPVLHKKEVLYYDGKIYEGWQLMKRNDKRTLDAVDKAMNEFFPRAEKNIESSDYIDDILNDLTSGKINQSVARSKILARSSIMIGKIKERFREELEAQISIVRQSNNSNSAGGCVY